MEVVDTWNLLLFLILRHRDMLRHGYRLIFEISKPSWWLYVIWSNLDFLAFVIFDSFITLWDYFATPFISKCPIMAWHNSGISIFLYQKVNELHTIKQIATIRVCISAFYLSSEYERFLRHQMASQAESHKTSHAQFSKRILYAVGSVRCRYVEDDFWRLLRNFHGTERPRWRPCYIA